LQASRQILRRGICRRDPGRQERGEHKGQGGGETNASEHTLPQELASGVEGSHDKRTRGSISA
jgi:hypothetical protein